MDSKDTDVIHDKSKKVIQTNKYKVCVTCGDSTPALLIPGASGWEKIMNEKENYKPTDSDFAVYSDIVQCDKCGLAYCNMHLPKIQLVKKYREVIDPAYLSEQKQREKTFRLYLKYIGKTLSTGKILEIGSNAGFFLNQAKKAGYEIEGIEPNTWAADYIKKTFKLKIINKNIDDMVFKEKFDAIVMFDVIEHLYDPFKVVKKLSTCLKKGGSLFMTTPDIGSLSAKIQGKKWYALRQQHIYYFSKRSMSIMLEKAGLETKKFIYSLHFFSIGYLLKQLKFPFQKFMSAIGIGKITIPVNLYDHFFIQAVKK